MMSQILLVRPRLLKSDFQQWMWKTAVMCKTLHGHHSTQWGSNIQLQEQEGKKTQFWLKGAFKCFCATFAFLIVGIWIIIWQEMKTEMLILWSFRLEFSKLTGRQASKQTISSGNTFWDWFVPLLGFSSADFLFYVENSCSCVMFYRSFPVFVFFLSVLYLYSWPIHLFPPASLVFAAPRVSSVFPLLLLVRLQFCISLSLLCILDWYQLAFCCLTCLCDCIWVLFLMNCKMYILLNHCGKKSTHTTWV